MKEIFPPFPRYLYMRLFFTIAILLLFSCNQKEQIKSASFSIDYPKSFQKGKEILYVIKDKLTRQMGLDSITKPADSFTLRIWKGFGLIVGVDLYEIKYLNNSWIGTHYYFQDKASDYSFIKKRDPYGLNDEVDSFWIAKRFIPLCGWKGFADTIIKGGVLKLPDDNDIPECKIGGFDGETFLFEWANKEKYRYYTFWAFSNSNCNENKTFHLFKSFFERELGINYCWPHCWINK